MTEQLLQQAQAAAKQQAQPDGRLAQAQAMMDEAAKPAPAPEAAQAQQANVTDLLNQLNF
jgi:3-oxoacyl-(acyl-carrier-protein) synthase